MHQRAFHILAATCLLQLAGAVVATGQVSTDGQVTRQTVGTADVCLYTAGTTPKMTASADVTTEFEWSYRPDESTAATTLGTEHGTTSSMEITEPGEYSVEYDG